MTRGFRQFAFRLHTFVGRYLLIFLMLNFVTGTLVLFAPEISLANRPDLWIKAAPGSEAASLGQVYDNVRHEFPDARVGSLFAPARPWFGNKVYAHYPDGRAVTVWARQDTGAVAGVSENAFLIRLSEMLAGLHTNLLVPRRPAELFVTFLAVIMLGVLITGLFSYRRFWKGFLRVPSVTTEGRMRAGTWHRLLAVWLLPFLFLMAVTGTVYFFDVLGFNQPFPGHAPVIERAAALPEGFAGSDIDAAVTTIRQRMPGFVPTEVALPSFKDNPIQVFGYDRATGQNFNANIFLVDPVGAQIVGSLTPENVNTMGWMMPLVTAIHYGTWGGFASILLWAVFGTGSALLLIMGAKVNIARNRAASPITATGGGVRAFLNGLGWSRWVYLLFLTGIAALIIRSLLR
ncbi:MAG: PepSY-associated TM helix domain-containing protein [Paracoccaceae bacterium]